MMNNLKRIHLATCYKEEFNSSNKKSEFSCCCFFLFVDGFCGKCVIRHSSFFLFLSVDLSQATRKKMSKRKIKLFFRCLFFFLSLFKLIKDMKTIHTNKWKKKRKRNATHFCCCCNLFISGLYVKKYIFFLFCIKYFFFEIILCQTIQFLKQPA